MTLTALTPRLLLCVGCVAGLTTVAALQAQTQEKPLTHDRAAMMASCQAMMAGMKADQDTLDDLLAKMNAATGQPKIDQMAAVLNELVAHQKAMRAHMMSMHQSAAPANVPKEQPEAGHEQHHP
jgi:pyruvate/oxaloacetate carboxyltransferase